MASQQHAVCTACNAVNRIPAQRDGKEINCGKCHQPLFGAIPPSLNQSAFIAQVTKSDAPVVVDFWASWCGPCKEAFPTLKELQKKYGQKGFVIVAVSVDEDVDDMKKFVSKQKPEFVIVRDKTTKLASKLDLASIPTTFILDRKGNVVEVHNGFDKSRTPKEYEDAIARLLKD